MPSSNDEQTGNADQGAPSHPETSNNAPASSNDEQGGNFEQGALSHPKTLNK
jgi:hypothetical protein